jgi:hypothetical protein
MKPTIAEFKRDILIDLVNKLGSEITNYLHMIEEDENIPRRNMKYMINK